MAPRVSIGLPVLNGERFIGEAIESVLSQSFEDFELVISDNGSTDGTAAIRSAVRCGGFAGTAPPTRGDQGCALELQHRIRGLRR